MGIFSGIKRAIFGGSAKSSSQSTSNSTATETANTSGRTFEEQNPWSGIMPSLNRYIGQLDSVYGGTPAISGYEQSGYDALAKAAGDNQGLTTGRDQMMATARGDYLGENPYLKDIAQRVGSGAMQTINSTFGGKGRSGSGLHQYYAGKGVADSMTDLYGSAYESERGRMLQAAGALPGFEAAELLGPQALIEAGSEISARPFGVNAQLGEILATLARLGGTSAGTADQTGTSTSVGTVNSTGKTKGRAEQQGTLTTKIANLFS